MKNAIYEKIKNAGKLPSPSGVALELLRLVEDEKATIDKITATVSSDPAIASRLLKLVNSPLYGATRTIASVSMAVKLLGRHTVKNLAVGFSLLAANRKGTSKSFKFERFWSESLACAVAAHNLADHFKCCAADEAFTVALLSRIGRLALATAYPKAYDAILDQPGTGLMLKLAEAERQAFKIDHNHLTAEMMADWRLANVFCESVCRQDVVDGISSDDDSRVTKVAGLLHLAGNVASVLAKPKVYREDLACLLESAHSFGFSTNDFNNRFDAVKEEWRDVAAIFSVHAKEAPSLREAHTRASRKHGSILVVDDDPLILRLFGKYLADAGYQTLTASNGAEALRLIHSEGCQIIVTDWTMPEMDGLQLCRAIRESEGIEFAYVIVVTAKTDLDSLAQAFDAGADDFLTKPCKKQELLARLKAGIRAVTSEEQLAAQRLAIHKTNAELSTLNRKLHQIATTDELTGLYNRREAMRRLADHWAAADRQRRPLACMLLDIDHFKQFNDTYGHNVGDAVLRETAHILKRNARTGETVFRIGGEEFVVLCPGATADMAAVGAERLRAAIEANRIRLGNKTLHVTISVGVSEKNKDTAKHDDLLKLADEMLYAAKHGGRNRVHTCGAGVPTAPQHAEPVHEKKTLPAASESSYGEAAHTTVLVVDDDPSARRLFRKLLEGDGFQVHEACDGVEALAKVPEIQPHVILMDVEMPNMDGLECIRKLKADPSFLDIPVIMVSGKTDLRQVRVGLEAGAQEYITKPIVHDEFLLRVRAMSQLSLGKAELLQSNSVRGEQARAMGILFELSRSLAAAETLDAIVQHTVTATAELMSSRRVSVMLPDPTGKNLVVASAMGIDEGLAAKILVPVGSGIAGKVFATGEPAVFNSRTEAANLTNRYESDFFASVPLASKALAVPNRVAGVLNVTERHGRRPFEPHEIEYLDLVCNMTASAIEQFQSGQAREHAHAAIVIGLAKLAEHRDFDTGKHLERVTQYALLLARELRKSSRHASTIDDRFLLSLEQAMPLHDIGKVSVPDAILRKPGQLTAAEFAAMKRHTEVGALAIQSVIEQAPEAGFLVMARDIAHGHHEWFDGSGYPRGCAGADIPLAARIAAVADVYDAMTTKRPYKEAFLHQKTVGIIRESSGSHFDPEVVDVFLGLERGFAELAQELRDQFNDPREKPAERELVACSTGEQAS